MSETIVIESLESIAFGLPADDVAIIEVESTGAAGAAGTNGTNGTNGGSTSAWKYKAKTNATSGYPTNGHLLWNNATQTSATSIIVSHLTDDDTDIELFLSFFVLNQKIFIQDRDESANNQVWLISGTPTVTGANTSTAYYTFPVTLVSSAGGAFTNNQSILFGQISVATNAVTSATTSDGTANLDVLYISSANGMATTGNDSNISTNGSISSIHTSGNLSNIFTAESDSHILTIGGGYIQTSSTFKITDGTFTTTLSSIKTADHSIGFPDASGNVVLDTNTVTLTNKTLTSPAINSATIGTAATFNATSYTYGAGAAAAMNQSLGTSSVDSRISSLFSAPYNFVQDDYLGRWVASTGNNAFNWFLVGSATVWSDAPWTAAGFIGGTNLFTNNNAYFYYMSSASAANIANFNGVVFDHVFSPNSLITLENIFVGIRNTASATAEVGRRGLYYEAGVDTNWQLLHETSAGVKTKVDTGKLVVVNQIVRVTMKFVSATQTDMIIATSTNTTPVTVSATSGFSCTGSLGLGFWLQSTTAANRFMLQMRSIVAWPSSTL
jgi:hypothetical protein